MSSIGVGFARMESREKCEQIIQMFNGNQLTGAKDPLLVKFADGGSKKKAFKSPDPNGRAWRDVTEVNVLFSLNSNDFAKTKTLNWFFLSLSLSICNFADE